MATLLITNVAVEEVHLGDFYHTLAVGESFTVERSASDLSKLADLIAELAAGNVTLSVTYSADEVASGLMSPPHATEAEDIAPVDAAALDASVVALRIPLTAGGGGADDVTAYAAGALPYKFRVLDAWAKIATAGAGGSTLDVRTQAGGGGTLLASLTSAATGRNDALDDASVVATPGSTEGLFVRRSDNTCIGEVFLLVRREN